MALGEGSGVQALGGCAGERAGSPRRLALGDRQDRALVGGARRGIVKRAAGIDDLQEVSAQDSPRGERGERGGEGIDQTRLVHEPRRGAVMNAQGGAELCRRLAVEHLGGAGRRARLAQRLLDDLRDHVDGVHLARLRPTRLCAPSRRLGVRRCRTCQLPGAERGVRGGFHIAILAGTSDIHAMHEAVCG